MFKWIKGKLESRKQVKKILCELRASKLITWFENGNHYIDLVYDKDSEYYKKHIAPFEKEKEDGNAHITSDLVKDEIKDYMTCDYLNKEKTNYDAR